MTHSVFPNGSTLAATGPRPSAMVNGDPVMGESAPVVESTGRQGRRLHNEGIGVQCAAHMLSIDRVNAKIASQSPSAREVFCNLPRGVIGAVRETHHWAKAVRGGESEKVESWKRRFKVGRQNRSVLETSDTRQDILA